MAIQYIMHTTVRDAPRGLGGVITRHLQSAAGGSAIGLRPNRRLHRRKPLRVFAEPPQPC